MSLVLWSPAAAPLPAHQLGQLSARGPVIDCAGQPWRWIGASCFMLPFRVWAGDTRVEAILDSYTWVGFNVLRCFWNATIMPPKRFDHLGRPLPSGRVPLDVMQATQALVNARGLFVEWTGGDFQVNMPDHDDQWAALQANAAIVGVNPVEDCNEYWQNGMDPAAMGELPGEFRSSGMYRLENEWEGQEDGEMLQTIPCVRDYFTRHHQRKSDWPRLSHDAMEFYKGWSGTVDSGEHKGEPEYLAGVGVPYVDNEPQLFVESGPSSTESSSPGDAFDFAAGMGLFGAGCTFHSEPGKDALPFTPTIAACAAQWVEGLRRVPFDQPFGEYTRGGRSNCPVVHSDELALRSYAMMRGSSAVVIVVRPQPGWQAEAANGWRIVDCQGDRGNLIFLAR